jgi:hypothetical protein
MAASLRALRRWVRLACAVVTLVVLAAPAALGAGAEPVLRMLGDTHAHVCKCGMPAGKCGCPECDRAEKERLSEHRVDRVATLKRHCDDEAPAMPLGAALPAGVLGAASAACLAVPRGDRIGVAASTTSPTSTNIDPPTPPPRSASV